uniref:Retrovirus-related Pol polyprotein from transposon TNT 1-94 n=1 Tax=Tanacetum cinerariifolium TaxID=118510 RepID=A0A6L2JFK2_TANCI|nr:retrovirus-related Pol polyprotein from transposon TNT 1-94 [Tanacetum cinerariifolium]
MEEFCLVSGLKFGVENSTDYNKTKDPILFRRRVFSLDLDGKPIRGKDVGLLIECDVFKKLDDNDAVSLCCVGILQLVLLGIEDRRHVPNWVLRAYFDGRSFEDEQIPRHLNRNNYFEVPSEMYLEFEKQRRGYQQVKEKNDDMYEKMTRSIEDMRRVQEANTTPIITDQHFSVSDISRFQSYQKKGKTKKLSPLNLGNTFVDENESGDDLTVTTRVFSTRMKMNIRPRNHELIYEYDSINGYAFLVQGCVVSWKATLQHVVALLTTEAGYIALTEAVKEAIWLKGLLEELGVELNRVTDNCNNQGAIHLSRSHVFHERSKHINVRYHFIRKVIEAKTVEVLKVGTKHNYADALTKVVPGHKLQHCLELLSVGDMLQVEEEIHEEEIAMDLSIPLTTKELNEENVLRNGDD